MSAAFNTLVAEIEIGPMYGDEATVGSVPSVVKRICGICFCCRDLNLLYHPNKNRVVN
jgi:hypothetical protein